MVRLGLDMFSLRSQDWTPFQQLDFCAKWGIQVVHYSEVRLIGGLAPDHLQRVRAYADDRGVQLELGMLSICPSSAIFDAAAGTAEHQIERIRSKILSQTGFWLCLGRQNVELPYHDFLNPL